MPGQTGWGSGDRFFVHKKEGFNGLLSFKYQNSTCHPKGEIKNLNYEKDRKQVHVCKVGKVYPGGIPTRIQRATQEGIELIFINMTRARFKVRQDGHWIICVAKNQEATEVIHGKLAAIRPMSQAEKNREIAEILQATDARCGIEKPLESYYPYKQWK